MLLHGQLRGMGREAPCELLARRTSMPGAHPSHLSFEYSDCVILNAPPDLPDGDYMLFFAGYSTVANRVRGLWGSFGAVVRDRSADGLTEGRLVDPGAMAAPRSDGRKKAAPAAQPEAETEDSSSNRSV